MEEEKKNMYDLKLNEIMKAEESKHNDCYIRRVPGGWIYELREADNISSVFVPFVDKRVELAHDNMETLGKLELDRIVEKLTVEEIKCLLNRKMKID